MKAKRIEIIIAGVLLIIALGYEIYSDIFTPIVLEQQLIIPSYRIVSIFFSRPYIFLLLGLIIALQPPKLNASRALKTVCLCLAALLILGYCGAYIAYCSSETPLPSPILPIFRNVVTYPALFIIPGLLLGIGVRGTERVGFRQLFGVQEGNGKRRVSKGDAVIFILTILIFAAYEIFVSYYERVHDYDMGAAWHMMTGYMCTRVFVPPLLWFGAGYVAMIAAARIFSLSSKVSKKFTIIMIVITILFAAAFIVFGIDYFFTGIFTGIFNIHISHIDEVLMTMQKIFALFGIIICLCAHGEPPAEQDS